MRPVLPACVWAAEAVFGELLVIGLVHLGRHENVEFNPLQHLQLHRIELGQGHPPHLGDVLIRVHFIAQQLGREHHVHQYDSVDGVTVDGDPRLTFVGAVACLREQAVDEDEGNDVDGRGEVKVGLQPRQVGGDGHRRHAQAGEHTSAGVVVRALVVRGLHLLQNAGVGCCVCMCGLWWWCYAFCAFGNFFVVVVVVMVVVVMVVVVMVFSCVLRLSEQRLV